jgi:prepilin-type N-terminal cleavage/methylation domain-containing protein
MRVSDSGYTILETLVALAILATMLVALYAAGGPSLNLIARSHAMENATLLAQSKLDELSADRDALPAESAGAFENTDFHWQIVAHNVPSHMAASRSRLQDVELTVTWPMGSHTQSVTVKTRHLGFVQP